MQEQTELVTDDIYLSCFHLLLDPLHSMCGMCTTLSKECLFTSDDMGHTLLIYKTNDFIINQSETFT
jgi:hypothetical protein